MTTTARAEQLRDEIAAALTDSGLIVEDVTVSPAGKRRVVRILLDRDLSGRFAPADDTSPVEPLTLDEIAAADNTISAALDTSDVLGEQPYTLEVSSPGTDRPLTAPRHFRRNVGRLVNLRTLAGESLTGRIVAAGVDSFDLDPGGPLRYQDIDKAKIELEFNRPTD